MTIRELTERMIKAAGCGRLDETVDTFKAGDPDQPLRGIVTTFIATREVIDKAQQMGANLVITHEPTYFNHLDETEAFQDDPVYLAKRDAIEQAGVVIWRWHDYWHRCRPDGIVTGVAEALGWADRIDPADPNVFRLEGMVLSDVLNHVTNSLDAVTSRYVGRDDMPVKTLGYLPGWSSGDRQVAFLRRDDIDALLVGETVEWQVGEYVRDALASGRNKALLAVGHCNSEEAGMKHLVGWLESLAPDVAITFVPAGDPLQHA